MRKSFPFLHYNIFSVGEFSANRCCVFLLLKEERIAKHRKQIKDPAEVMGLGRVLIECVYMYSKMSPPTPHSVFFRKEVGLKHNYSDGFSHCGSREMVSPCHYGL